MAGLTFVCSVGTGVLWNAIYFIAESEYGFKQSDTLLLAFVSGVFYTAVAVSAGWIVRALERHMTPRSALALVLIAQGLLAPLVLVFPGVGMLWIATVVMMSLGALQWPIVQHYLVSGRHGHAMRDAIGWFNASWMAATAISLAAVGPLKAAGLMSWAIPALLPVNLIALAFLMRFPPVPAFHDDGETARHVPPSYAPLLAASRVLHPMGYLVIGALAPILPYLFKDIGTDSSLQAPLGSIWHVARFAAVVVLWRAAFWHGRGTTLVVAGIMLAGGFAISVAAASEGMLALGLVGIGAGQGVIYYCAIYYGLAVGGAKVDAGGTHEALVGAGYFLGPLLGLATFTLGFGPSTFIGVVLGALAVGFVVAIARAGRASSHRTA
ncbi:MAG: hypothetical protein RLY21_692 [Planctomycetota bacterium]|jgi:hypothetical protein